MKLTNSLTRKLEDFEPAEPGHLRMYNCGPTVYGEQHIGNFRTFALGDTLRRWCELKGWRVTQVVNITDVGHLTQDDIDEGEDKVVMKAREMGWTALQVSEHFTNLFLEDRKKLLFIEPHHFTKATEHIPEMIDLIRKLLDRGCAYAVGGNVYFDVTKCPEYGRLSGNSLETLKAGARIKVHPDKRHPADFALWKTDAKHLMQWDAPWGRGFPGWHIECSAMSMKYLGETFDIHTGGEDNIFPHHEAEIAQSEAATGKPFVRLWLHSRHIMWEGKKLSKSLGNIVRLKDATDRGYAPAEVRYALICTRYSQQVNFSWKMFDDARSAVGRLVEFRSRLQEAAAQPAKDVPMDLERREKEFGARMDDDLDVAGALGVVHTFARDGNRAIDVGLGGSFATPSLELLERFDRVFGVLGSAPREGPPEEVVRLAEERQSARKRKDYTASDKARNRIRELGWSVEDTPSGPKYRKL